MNVEILGHKYSNEMAKKYRLKEAWPCIVDSCQRLHVSKHEKCLSCRQKNCSKCNQTKTISGICAFCAKKRTR